MSDADPRPANDSSLISADWIRAWRLAAGAAPVDTELRAIYSAVLDSTRAARPICVASGACCRFEAYGHRLYVTGLEAAWFLRELDVSGRLLTREAVLAARGAGTCPFLREGCCTVHTIRPFACRTFFCDPRSEAWQTELHESCHGRIRALHDSLSLPYHYGEWRDVLGELAEAPRTLGDDTTRAD